MQAGRMKYKLELLEPVRIADRFGAETTDWQKTRTVSAERVKFSGSRHIEVSEQFADYRVEFNIRDAHAVDEGWRARQLGGHLYTVVNIIPNKDRGMLTLVCERVNE